VICNLDFGIAYGPLAEGFIHVHHLVPISDIGAECIVNPVEDMSRVPKLSCRYSPRRLVAKY
jgi:5-methylcytosine-specific restriction protein A